MASTSETGHAKNLSQFGNLIFFCEGYGPAYNPVKSDLPVAALHALLDKGRVALDQSEAGRVAYNNTLNARMPLYKSLQPRCTQVVSALAACGIADEVVKDAQGILRKLRGKRAPGKRSEPPTGGEQPAGGTHSVSQQSYVQQAEHLAKLIELLLAEPLYKPNEAHLKTPVLQQLLQQLRTINAGVAQAYVAWSNARLKRNVVLYQQDTGLVPVALEVKQYIKSVFGAASPQYRQVQGLQFTRTRN
jgi:hypothetical protein